MRIDRLPDNPRLLREVLRALSIELVDEGGDHFLESAKFESEAFADRVHARATRLESTVADIERNDPVISCGFKVGGVYETMPDGSRRQHAFATVHIEAKATLTVYAEISGLEAPDSTEDRLRREERQREQEFQELRKRATTQIASAFRDDRALRVQQLLRVQPNGNTLWQIAEIIESDLGGGITRFVSENQWTRFARSINHPIFGETARHSDGGKREAFDCVARIAREFNGRSPSCCEHEFVVFDALDPSAIGMRVAFGAAKGELELFCYKLGCA